MNSAVSSNADILLLDIEDSVQPLPQKQVARDKVIEYLESGSLENRVVFPRINDRESGQLLKDLYELSLPGV